MTEAIKLAIEKGGYKKSEYWFPRVVEWGIICKGDDQDQEDFTNAEILLDPLFWQALGKALGWKEWDWNMKIEGTPIPSEGKYIPWKEYAHSYFDLVLTGGDVKKFWQELLKEAN